MPLRARKAGGRFALQTFRSHDQYNTTVYGLDDRYRGVYGERQVIFIHPEDLKAMEAEAGDRVDVVGAHDDGIERVARAHRHPDQQSDERSGHGRNLTDQKDAAARKYH